MDKLKKALSGREDQDDEERGFVSQVQLFSKPFQFKLKKMTF